MKKWIILALIVLILLIACLAPRADASAPASVPAGAPAWKYVEGRVFSWHTHGSGLARAYHLWVTDRATDKTYTCSVPRAIYERKQYTRYVACPGRLGTW